MAGDQDVQILRCAPALRQASRNHLPSLGGHLININAPTKVEGSWGSSLTFPQQVVASIKVLLGLGNDACR